MPTSRTRKLLPFLFFAAVATGLVVVYIPRSSRPAPGDGARSIDTIELPAEKETASSPAQSSNPEMLQASKGVASARAGTFESPPPSASVPAPKEPPAEPLLPLKTREGPVDWEAAEQHPRFETSQLSEEQMEAVKTAPVPVLLPADSQLVETAFITTGDGWYAASMKGEEHFVVVSGSTRTLDVPGLKAPSLPEYGHHDLGLDRGEGILEVTFKAFGVVYNVAVECSQPSKDVHCTENGYALALVDHLLLAKGNER